MRKLLSSTLLIISLFFFKTPIVAQEIHGGNDLWFLILNDVNLSKKFFFSNEFHHRRHEMGAVNEQGILRPAINWRINQNVIGTLGYSWVQTQPYGKYPLPETLTEHNFWEQITLNHKAGSSLTVSHRYRLEHRYVEDLSTENPSDYTYKKRFRYRITLNQSLKKWDNKMLYAALFDEFWINMDPGIHPNSMDRNWLYLGLGFEFKPGHRFELAYLDQWMRQQNGARFEHNPTLQCTWRLNFDLSSKKE